jgi:CPA1 family monovalent cation:H+ antiporter
MGDVELLIGLLAGIVAVVLLARQLRLPYPILLVLAGVGVSLIPGLPQVRLDPDVVLFLFIPPLLYAAAFSSSPRELREQARSIGVLAIGLVIVSTAGVAVALHLVVPGFGWAEAFLLGAILSPTDPVVAVAVLERAGVPPRLRALLEGESLVNDGSGLTLYKIALGAATSGTFSLLNAAGKLVGIAVGGVAVGLAVGWLAGWLRRRVDDPPVEIAISLLVPYLAFVLAEVATVSGVLAAVAAGLYSGSSVSELFRAGTRLQAKAFWDVLVFLLESALFLLLGLQLRRVASGIEGLDAGRVALAVAISIGVVVALRVAWMYTVSPLLRRLIPGRSREEPPRMRAVERLLVGWAGMRGAISLAAALAIPESVDERNLIVFVTFAVIVVGLTVQGLTLPLVARRIESPDEQEARDHAREEAARAALAKLDEVDGEADEEAVARLRSLYEMRLARIGSDDAQVGRRLRLDLIDAEREALGELHARGELDRTLLEEMMRELDLDDERLR